MLFKFDRAQLVFFKVCGQSRHSLPHDTSRKILYKNSMNNNFKIIQPQVPKGGEIFLDHIAWFVPNISHASKVFDRLGFNLTTFVAQNNLNPSGGAPIPAGTGNRCAMLGRGYLEILTTVDGEDSTPLARQLIKSVERYTGVHLIAFTVDDTEATDFAVNSSGNPVGDATFNILKSKTS